MPFCGNCGNQLSDLAVACPKCGTPTARGLVQPSGPVLQHEYSSAPRLRPLGVGEVIDAAVKMYTRNGRSLLTLVAIVVVPVQILNAFIVASAPPVTRIVPGTNPLQPTNPFLNATDIRRFVAATIVTGLLSFVASQIATGASLRLVGESYLGERPDWRASLRFALDRLGRLIGYGFLLLLLLFALGIGSAIALVALGVLTHGLGLLVLIPAVIVLFFWVGVSLYVGVPSLLFEDLSITAAMRRSFELVRGRWWAVFGIVFLAQLLVAIVGGVFGLLLGLFVRFGTASAVAIFTRQVIVGAVVGVLTTPFLAATTAITYFDLRVRKEGFDLELLAHRVGRPDLAPPPPPPPPSTTAPPPPRRPPPVRPGAGIVEESPVVQEPAAPRRARPRRPGFEEEPESVPEPETEAPDEPPAPTKRAPRKAAPRRPRAEDPEPEAEPPDEPPPPPKRAPRKPAPRRPRVEESELPDEPPPAKRTPRKSSPRKAPPPPPPPLPDDEAPEDPEFHHS